MARHYALDRSLDDGGTWLEVVADEAPGPNKTLTISGLTPGTYPVKLRLRPLSGIDTTPVLSDTVSLTVSSDAASENVSLSSQATPTLSDIHTLKEQLLSVLGVSSSSASDKVASTEQSSVSASTLLTSTQLLTLAENVSVSATVSLSADTMQAVEALIVAAVANVSVTDSQNGVISENPTVSGITDGFSLDVQQLSEQLLSSITVGCTASDVLSATEQLVLTAIGQTTTTDGLSARDNVALSASGAATTTDLAAMLENVLVAANTQVTQSSQLTISTPAQVTNLSASNSPAQITVTWTAVSGATSYNVYYSTTNNSAEATKISGATGTTSYSINGPLTAGTTYYVWVSAQSSSGEGQLSASASASASAAYDYFGSGFEGWASISSNATVSLSTGTGQNGGVSLYGTGEGVWLDEEQSDVGAISILKSVTATSGRQILSFWYRFSAGATYSVTYGGSMLVFPTAIIKDGEWHQVTTSVYSVGTKDLSIAFNSDPGSGNFVTGYIDNITLDGAPL